MEGRACEMLRKFSTDWDLLPALSACVNQQLARIIPDAEAAGKTEACEALKKALRSAAPVARPSSRVIGFVAFS